MIAIACINLQAFFVILMPAFTYIWYSLLVVAAFCLLLQCQPSNAKLYPLLALTCRRFLATRLQAITYEMVKLC
jgi:hypothetical protein